MESSQNAERSEGSNCSSQRSGQATPLPKVAAGCAGQAMSSVAMDYFELAQASSMRMCLDLEEKFPDIRARQLELMMYLCLVAYNSQIYDGVCEDAWLRTTIILNNDFQHDRHHVFLSGSPELLRLMEMAGIPRGTGLCQASWEWLQREISTLTSRVEIRSNIVPRRAYRERLEELIRCHHSFWATVQLSMLRRSSCCVTRRGFFPITVINQARELDVPLKQKVEEWRRNGGRCDLAAHLQTGSVVPHAQRIRAPGLRNIRRREVSYSNGKNFLGGGATAAVHKVTWRNGTYAMKSYNFIPSEGSEATDPSQTERDVALRVELHPHIVHGFGYSEEGGAYHLLMEVLETTLTAYAVEQLRVDAKPPFSRADTYDVLEQIASAMEHLHRHELVHGDVKPDNILLNSFEILGSERHFLAKVTDFGEAQFIVPGRAFIPVGLGTTKFAAPELLRFRNDRLLWLRRTRQPAIESDSRQPAIESDPKKMDVYSFGGVAHEVLTGYPVYSERDATEFNTEFKAGVINGNLKPSGSKVWRDSGLEERFPTELIELVERCWELYPQERPSFSEILAELKKCRAKARGENRVYADRWKFFAAVFLLALISCLSSLIKEKRVADPFKFIALILFAFISISYLVELSSVISMKFLLALRRRN